jgi:hypothetical protein
MFAGLRSVLMANPDAAILGGENDLYLKVTQ